MSKSLKINNIALIENLFIEFDGGLNILTGETGAGKSIIFDALNFVLGARSDKSLIRTGESVARVDAMFDVDLSNETLKNILVDNDIDCDDGEILISRKMSVDGKSDIKVNGYPITSSMLRQITSNLVDIYGQQEQVSLLKTQNQLALLDNFASSDLDAVKSKYIAKYNELKNINKRLDSLGGDEFSASREKDYLSFVIDEIVNANITEQEERELTDQKQRLNNIEKIASGVNVSQNALNASLNYISQATSALNAVSQFDKTLLELYERLSSSKLELEDITDCISEYDVSDYSQSEFDKIDERLDKIKELKRKYGGSCESVLEFLKKSQSRLYELENSDKLRSELEKYKGKLVEELLALAVKMNTIRAKYAKVFSQRLLLNLAQLGMPNAQIDFAINGNGENEEDLTSNGLGKVELLFSANLGGELKLLNKVASGGELSRLMLGIKAIVAETDNMPTMIFDEIDAGISGKMAQAVGEKMAEIGKYHQVIAITHSVQIASLADCHFMIRKIEKNGKTTSETIKLSDNERVEELARFMSGDNLTQNTLNSARELLEKQREFKASIK